MVVVSNEEKRKSIDEDFKVTSWGYRHQQSLIMFLMLTVAYSMRSCMGVALVAMTSHEVDQNAIPANLTVGEGNTTWNATEEKEFRTHGFFNAILLIPPYPEFKWSKKVQDTVISSFFWGYMSLQIPAGHLAHKFGAHYLLTGSMFINCVVSLFLPLASYYGGWICTLIFRMIQGFSQACVMPGMHTFFGKWAPLEERGRLTTVAYGGSALGTVLGLPITGFISASSLGWPGIFRFYGILSGVMCAVLWFCCADTPAKHPKISFAERRYIEGALGQKGNSTKSQKVPWGKILRSTGLYAIVVAHIGQTWGQIFLYSEVPAYMNNIMKVNIKANGLLTALPFLVMWLTNFFFSWLSDFIVSRKILSVTHTRKLANSLGCIPAAIGCILLAFVPRNIYIIETILVVICAFKISTHSGFQVTHIDMSPNYAGTMMAVSNFISNLCGCLTPLVAGFVLTDVHDVKLWRILFFITSGFYFCTNLFFVIFGTAERAEWDKPETEDDLDQVESPMLEMEKKMKENS